jgi:cellulose synthase/poly-beta-1,6-N-acetylglucosamine synthase-like glycosyltransferase
VFCAFNEEEALPEKIRNIRALKQYCPNMQVLAYSDCSQDMTNQLLEQADDVLTPVIGTVRVGKLIGMQKLVAMTRQDIIIFTDANVIMEPESVPRILRYFTNPDIGSVAGTLVYRSNDAGSDTPTAAVGGLYWRLEEHIKRLESETGSTMGADGSVFARRRAGYPPLPGDLVDDLGASISVLFDGLRCVSAADVRAYEQSVHMSREEFRRKRRIACGSMSTYRYLLPKLRTLSWIDRFKFLSHKTLRWWGGLFLFFALVFAVLGGWSAGFLLVTIFAIGGAGLVLGLLGPKGIPVLSPVYEILLAVIATSVGVIESLAGRKYQTWTPAKSR